jgi:hypothetical protein
MGVISSCQCGRKGYCLAALVSRQKDIADVRDSSEDGEETMPHEWEDHDDELAAGSSCPMPACGTLAVAYGSRHDVEGAAFLLIEVAIQDNRLVMREGAHARYYDPVRTAVALSRSSAQ